jgi:hypothetical protein
MNPGLDLHSFASSKIYDIAEISVVKISAYSTTKLHQEIMRVKMINKKQKKLIQACLQRTHSNQPYPVSIKQEVRVHTASILQQEQRKYTASQYAQP